MSLLLCVLLAHDSNCTLDACSALTFLMILAIKLHKVITTAALSKNLLTLTADNILAKVHN